MCICVYKCVYVLGLHKRAKSVKMKGKMFWVASTWSTWRKEIRNKILQLSFTFLTKVYKLDGVGPVDNIPYTN